MVSSVRWRTEGRCLPIHPSTCGRNLSSGVKKFGRLPLIKIELAAHFGDVVGMLQSPARLAFAGAHPGWCCSVANLGRRQAISNNRVGFATIKIGFVFNRLFNVIYSVSLFVALYLFWLLLSGMFTPFLMSAGVGSALVVVWFARRMDVVDAEGHPIHLGPRAFVYWIWLLKEIVKSAWEVSKIILHPKLPISPTLVHFRPTQKTNVGLVLHANSITLTPGTITIEAHANEFLVHGLTRAAALGVVGSEMDRRVTACEGRT